MSRQYHYRIHGFTNDWFKSYLTDRKQCKFANGETSDMTNVEAGVSQGSVLSPLIFLIYINDLSNCTDEGLRLFVNDVNSFIAHKNPNMLKQKPINTIKNINE